MGQQEFDEIFEKSVQVRAEAIITSEKDAVKMPVLDGAVPLHVMRVEMLISDESAFVTGQSYGIDGGMTI